MIPGWRALKAVSFNYHFKVITVCLFLIAVSFVDSIGVKFTNAAPTYSAIQQIGQWDMTTNQPDHRGPNLNGFDNPADAVVDTVHHRLFVIDTDNNRVLVFALDGSNRLTDHVPDFVLGQVDFIHGHGGSTPSASTLFFPSGIAYDAAHDRLFVGEDFNSRVLVFDTTTIVNGENAVNVLGQPDFETHDCCTAAANTIGDPSSLAYDDSRNYLYVSDQAGSRVLVFDLTTINDNEDAVNVLGQANFTDATTGCPPSGLAAGKFCGATRLAYDNAHRRLFVSDYQAERVTIFDMSAITDGEDAVNVLGQPNLTSFVDAGLNAHELEDPHGMSYDPVNDRLFLAEANFANRALIFDTATITNNEDAVNVLGQTSFTVPSSCVPGTTTNHTFCLPLGLVYNSASSELYVLDSDSSRMVLFDLTTPIVNGQSAIAQLGQNDFTLRWENRLPGPNDIGFHEPPALAIDPIGHHLYVTDGDSRIVILDLDENNIPIDATLDHVIGQSDLFAFTGCNNPATDVCTPQDVEVDPINHLLFVSDYDYNRVTIYQLDANNLPLDNVPDYVLGQTDLNGDNCGTSATELCGPMGLDLDETNHRLYVADESNSRVVAYQLTTGNLPVDNTADIVTGALDFDGNTDCSDNANCLQYPAAVTVDSEHNLLYVGDTENSRVLLYNLDETGEPLDSTADHVLGQQNFDDVDCNQNLPEPSAATLCWPSGITIDSTNNRLLVSDNDNDRILIYNLNVAGLPADNIADGLLGQPDFATVENCFIGGTYTNAAKLCTEGKLQDNDFDATSGRLYVADSESSRVLAFQIADADPSTPPPDSPDPGDGRNDGSNATPPPSDTSPLTPSITSTTNPSPSTTTPATSDDAFAFDLSPAPPNPLSPAPTPGTAPIPEVLDLRTIPYSTAVLLPYLVLLLLLILILMLLYQQYREEVALRQLRAAYQKNKQLAEGKASFLALASHYLRTPLTLIKGGSELLASQPMANPAILTGLTAAIAGFGAAIENILSRAEQQTAGDVVVSPDTSDQSPPARSPLFWVPLGLAGLLLAAFNGVFWWIETYDFSLANTAIQLLLFAILGVGLYIAVRGIFLTRRTAPLLRQQAAGQAELDRARSQLINESAQTLTAQLQTIQNYTQQLPAGAGEKTITEGVSRIHQTLIRFEAIAAIAPVAASAPFVAFDVQTLLQNASNDTKNVAQQKQITITSGDNIALASQEPTRIAAIVSSLLANAMEHSPSSSVVEVTASIKHHTATITVQDHGEGIPQEKINQLFEPFTKTEATTSFDHPGIGLSLFQDQLLATSLGGKMHIVSSANDGTAASISFPTR